MPDHSCGGQQLTSNVRQIVQRWLAAGELFHFSKNKERVIYANPEV
jgi:hypothetical protein